MFSPIIALLAWIPLVGHLLATILSFAAAIFALIFATCLHFLIMGVSWLVYRPVYGILMLSVVALGVAACVFGGKPEAAAHVVKVAV